jgi:hypothetical protein
MIIRVPVLVLSNAHSCICVLGTARGLTQDKLDGKDPDDDPMICEISSMSLKVVVCGA